MGNSTWRSWRRILWPCSPCHNLKDNMRIRFVLLTAVAFPMVFAQSQADRDWPMFNRDLASTRYSPLKQIDASNVAKLTKAWQYRFNREGKTISGLSASELYQEITPIVVNGIMYSPSGDRVVALEAETGKELWTYEIPDKGLASFRGVSYWA